MTDRDQFAAAALTGLLTRDPIDETRYILETAWDWADAMLAERDNTPAQVDKCSGNVTTDDTSPERVVTYADSQHDEKRIVSDRFHDAVPAATATAKSVGTDKAEPLTRQQTGNPGEQSGTGNTQDWHATPSEGSVPTQRTVGEELGSRLRKMNDYIEQEPTAYAVMYAKNSTAIECTFPSRDEAVEWAEPGQQIVPLYAHPQDRVVRLPRSWAKLDDCEMVGVKRVTAALDAAGVNWRFG